MSEIINLTDELRIRRLDERNVTVEKLSETKGGEMKWDQYNRNGRGPFFADAAGACRWVLERGVLDGGGESDLEGAIDEYRKVATKLERAVKSAVAKA